MYNLAHIYMYEDSIKNDINKSIELLIKSSDYFSHSLNLLILILIKQFGFNIDVIKKEIDKLIIGNDNLSFNIILNIYRFMDFDKSIFEEVYESYKTIYFLYNIKLKHVFLTDDNETQYQTAKNVSSFFYEGFGLNI